MLKFKQEDGSEINDVFINPRMVRYVRAARAADSSSYNNNDESVIYMVNHRITVIGSVYEVAERIGTYLENVA